MPLAQNAQAIAAAATVQNLLTGNVFERAPYDCKVEIAVVGDSANFQCEVSSGADILMPEGPPSIANRVPIYPDDYTLVDVAASGELIRIKARNTDAANPHTIYWGVRITPIG
jgi:hypothetical protein